MKTIGLLGGMSWESTVAYYRLINQTVATERGGLTSAPILLYSVNFEPIEALQRAGDWDELGRILVDAAQRLEGAGADLLVLATNTMHRVAQAIEAGVDRPLLHIADATGAAIRHAGLGQVGLLGTRFTMQQDFYRRRLEQANGISMLTPEPADQETVHRIIFEELCRGRVEPASRAAYRAVMARLAARGAEGIVLGCTEIAMLVGPDDADVPLLDTTAIHARHAALAALGRA